MLGKSWLEERILRRERVAGFDVALIAPIHKEHLIAMVCRRQAGDVYCPRSETFIHRHKITSIRLALRSSCRFPPWNHIRNWVVANSAAWRKDKRKGVAVAWRVCLLILALVCNNIYGYLVVPVRYGDNTARQSLCALKLEPGYEAVG